MIINRSNKKQCSMHFSSSFFLFASLSISQPFAANEICLPNQPMLALMRKKQLDAFRYGSVRFLRVNGSNGVSWQLQVKALYNANDWITWNCWHQPNHIFFRSKHDPFRFIAWVCPFCCLSLCAYVMAIKMNEISSVSCWVEHNMTQ